MDEQQPKARPPVLANFRFLEHAEALRGRDLADTFAYIYQANMWGSPESRSGVGSEDAATRHLQLEIPALLRRLGAQVLLDIPCGDFGWLSRADLGQTEYIGADIVADLVGRNAAQYGLPGSKRRFLHCDLTRDPLPRADVVLCRDCLVHLPFAEVFRAFANLKRSGSRYLLMTTFTEMEANVDIVIGDWWPMNFERPPFQLGAPLACIVEGCTEAGGAYADKSLGLWEIGALPDQP